MIIVFLINNKMWRKKKKTCYPFPLLFWINCGRFRKGSLCTRDFIHSKLQGEDEQIGYSCVIYKVREGPFISTPFNSPRKSADHFWQTFAPLLGEKRSHCGHWLYPQHLMPCSILNNWRLLSYIRPTERILITSSDDKAISIAIMRPACSQKQTRILLW